jgi:hypothetical protein
VEISIEVRNTWGWMLHRKKHDACDQADVNSMIVISKSQVKSHCRLMANLD